MSKHAALGIALGASIEGGTVYDVSLSHWSSMVYVHIMRKRPRSTSTETLSFRPLDMVEYTNPTTDEGGQHCDDPV